MDELYLIRFHSDSLSEIHFSIILRYSFFFCWLFHTVRKLYKNRFLVSVTRYSSRYDLMYMI
jgi:hypothetical protein